jgi:hypothetical protein
MAHGLAWMVGVTEADVIGRHVAADDPPTDSSRHGKGLNGPNREIRNKKSRRPLANLSVVNTFVLKIRENMIALLCNPRVLLWFSAVFIVHFRRARVVGKD